MRRRSRCAGSSRVSFPSISTRPEVGSTSRLIIRSSVDFPEPEVPTMTVMVRGSMSIDTSSTTVVESYRLQIRSIVIIAAPGASGR